MRNASAAWVALLVFYALPASSQTIEHLSREDSSVAVSLPFGITLATPASWRTDRTELASAWVPESLKVIPKISPEADGHLIAFATPESRAGEATVEISIMPTTVSQSEVQALSGQELAAADTEFRRDTERSLAETGNLLLTWEGTTRVSIGGRLALLRRYWMRFPARQTTLVESYGFYLGHESIQLRLLRAAGASKQTLEELEQIRGSFCLSLAVHQSADHPSALRPLPTSLTVTHAGGV